MAICPVRVGVKGFIRLSGQLYARGVQDGVADAGVRNDGRCVHLHRARGRASRSYDGHTR